MGNWFTSWFAQVLLFLGVFAIGGGIFMGWRMKQIWLEFDPQRSMAYQEFDYFVWYDEMDMDDTEFAEDDESFEAAEEEDGWAEEEPANETPAEEPAPVEPTPSG